MSSSANSGAVQASLDGVVAVWPCVPSGGWHRVLLKLSGEAFAGAGGGLGVDPDVVSSIARQIADVVRTGTQVAVVIGGTATVLGPVIGAIRAGAPRRCRSPARCPGRARA